MKKILILVRILVFLVILCNLSCASKSKVYVSKDNELTVENVTQKRDISIYEDSGHFYCNSWSEKNTVKLGEKTVCDFILKNLRGKRRGYIKISCRGADSQNTHHIFVEPDEKGEWSIAVKTLGKHAIEEYDNKITDSQYSSVECIENYSENTKWTLFYITKDGQKLRSM